MSMISPMPFCPSFDPWKKLTPVQVRISRPRIQNGGGSAPSGASYSFSSLTIALHSRNRQAAITNPKMGESNNDLPIFSAWPQSTPLVPDFTLINWLAMPTPMMEPIKVCELEAGSPNHQVPTFQRMAAIKRAKTMAKPALLPTCKINSTGRSETMPKATAPVEVTTPAKFQKPDQTTAMFGSKEWV